MKLHRNSQKRIFIEDGIYFVTSKAKDNYPYFKESIFCDLFVENLKICKKLKGFYLYGWVLMYDHFHLLLKPNDKFNVSKIMKSLKEQVSCAINRIATPSEGTTTHPEGATTSSRLRDVYDGKYNILQFQHQFHKNHQNQDSFLNFQWQKSFHDHYIRNKYDFDNHWWYIKHNPEKANMPTNWKYTFLNPEFEDLIDDFI